METTPKAEEAARFVWGLARDLATPKVTGRTLDSQRNVKHLATLIDSLANDVSRSIIAQLHVDEIAAVRKQNALLTSELKTVKAELKKRREEMSDAESK